MCSKMFFSKQKAGVAGRYSYEEETACKNWFEDSETGTEKDFK